MHEDVEDAPTALCSAGRSAEWYVCSQDNTQCFSTDAKGEQIAKVSGKVSFLFGYLTEDADTASPTNATAADPTAKRSEEKSHQGTHRRC